MKLFTLIPVLLALASTAFSDQLVVSGQPKKGTFQGYESSKFQFMTAEGRFLKEPVARVAKLILDKPQRATYQATDGKPEETALLKGFDKRAFTFEKGGKDVTLPQNKVKAIELLGEEVPVVAGAGAEFIGGRYPIPRMDLDALAGGQLTPAQQATLAKFKDAKKAYDEFVGQSTAMVQDMDKQTGARRETLLNQLRMRKGEEQPLKNALIASYRSLTDVFAEPSGDEPAAEPAKPAGGVKEKPGKPASRTRR